MTQLLWVGRNVIDNVCASQPRPLATSTWTDYLLQDARLFPAPLLIPQRWDRTRSQPNVASFIPLSLPPVAFLV